MQTLYGIDRTFDTRRPIFATMGMFDGMHLGHLALLRQLIVWAKTHGGYSSVITFDRHPREVVFSNSPRIITPLNQKLYILSRLGVEGTIVIPFTDEIAQMEAESFIESVLVSRFGVKGVLLGFNNRFGKNGEGNFALLRRVGSKHGLISRQAHQLTAGGYTLSSTLIRDAVSKGNLAMAERLLGRKYSIFGKVIHGKRVGRNLGFPTANIEVAHTLLPPCGIYAAITRVANDFYPSAVFIGPKSLCDDGLPPNVESHLIGVTADLYGKDIEIILIEFLRSDQRFVDKQALSVAIRNDVRNAYRAACEVKI